MNDDDEEDMSDDELDPDSHDSDGGNFIQVRYKKRERKEPKDTSKEGAVCKL